MEFKSALISSGNIPKLKTDTEVIRHKSQLTKHGKGKAKGEHILSLFASVLYLISIV